MKRKVKPAWPERRYNGVSLSGRMTCSLNSWGMHVQIERANGPVQFVMGYIPPRVLRKWAELDAKRKRARSKR